MVCLTKNKPDGTSNTVQLLLTGEIPIAALLSHQGQPTVFKDTAQINTADNDGVPMTSSSRLKGLHCKEILAHKDSVIEDFLSYVHDQLGLLLSQGAMHTHQKTQPYETILYHATSNQSRNDNPTVTSAKSRTSPRRAKSTLNPATKSETEEMHSPTGLKQSKVMRRLKLFPLHKDGGEEQIVNANVVAVEDSTIKLHNHKSSSLTLADFMTPERQRRRRQPRGTLTTPFVSPPCGSWASDLHKSQITPLRVQPQNRINDDEDRNYPNCGGPFDLESDNSPQTFMTAKECNNDDENKVISAANTRRILAESCSNNSCLDNRMQNPGVAAIPDFSNTAAKPSRRITPTPVSSDNMWDDFRQHALFIPQSPHNEISSEASMSSTEEQVRGQTWKTKLSYCNVSTASKDHNVKVWNTPQEVSSVNQTNLCRQQRRLQVGNIDVSNSKSSTHSGNPNSYKSEAEYGPSPLVRFNNTDPVVTERLFEPEPSSVTHRDEIERASSLYASLIAEGKTADICGDLHLLVQVLCCQITRDDNKASSAPSSDNGAAHPQILSSIHNVVHFAVQTLANSEVLIELMDHSILRLLSENERLVKFDSALASLLSKRRLEVSEKMSQSKFTNVSFQPETDSSSNFPSEKLFISFKKQRDAFYELKRLWDKHHTESGWNFRVHCADKVRQIFTAGTSLSNYIHFCRLFVDQLLLSCIKDLDDSWSDLDGITLSLLNNLKLSQPDKYRKLRDRFAIPETKPSEVNGMATFERDEVFYRTFIEVVEDCRFGEHLRDALSLKLRTLCDMCSEYTTEQGAEYDSSFYEENFSICVLSTRLIGKFLGFVIFYPYKTDEMMSSGMEELCGTLRTSRQPSLDVHKMYIDSLVRQSSFMTIPWLVHYISQIDACSLLLPYYCALVSAMKGRLQWIKQQLHRDVRTVVIIFEYTNLSWLFSLKQFENILCSTDADSCEDANVKYHLPSLKCQLVRLKLVYDCSLALQLVKHSLVQYVLGVNSRVSHSRKITPLSSTEPVRTKTTLNGTGRVITGIQHSLEDHFFHNQPASLLKTAHFIAERVSSSYIKSFRAKQLCNAMAKCKSGILTHVVEVDDMDYLKIKMSPIIQEMCSTMHIQLHTLASGGVGRYFKSRVRHILRLLLPCDVDEVTIQICEGVITRQGHKRVTNWLITNLTRQYIAAELDHELLKYIRASQASSSFDSRDEFIIQTDFQECNAAETPSELVMHLQSLAFKIRSALEQDDQIENELLSLVVMTKRCVYTQPLLAVVGKCICHLILEVAVTMCDRRATNMRDSLLSELLSLFSLHVLNDIWSEVQALIPDHNEQSGNISERFLLHLMVQRKQIAV